MIEITCAFHTRTSQAQPCDRHGNPALSSGCLVRWQTVCPAPNSQCSGLSCGSESTLRVYKGCEVQFQSGSTSEWKNHKPPTWQSHTQNQKASCIQLLTSFFLKDAANSFHVMHVTPLLQPFLPHFCWTHGANRNCSFPKYSKDESQLMLLDIVLLRCLTLFASLEFEFLSIGYSLCGVKVPLGHRVCS